MLKPTTREPLWIGLALVTLMLATRGQHLAALDHPLPDASLALFFLAGFYLRPAWAFLSLCAEALVIDLVAVTWGGVSGFCLSPAYVLLAPAYGVMWAAGRWYAGRYRFAWSTLGVLAASLLGAAVVAELLASGGFYLFSGRFAEPSLLELGARLLRYFPTSLGALLLYVGLAALVHTAFRLVGIGASRGVLSAR